MPGVPQTVPGTPAPPGGWGGVPEPALPVGERAHHPTSGARPHHTTAAALATGHTSRLWDRPRSEVSVADADPNPRHRATCPTCGTPKREGDRDCRRCCLAARGRQHALRQWRPRTGRSFVWLARRAGVCRRRGTCGMNARGAGRGHDRRARRISDPGGGAPVNPPSATGQISAVHIVSPTRVFHDGAKGRRGDREGREARRDRTRNVAVALVPCGRERQFGRRVHVAPPW